jgi:hypothetical protein
MIITVHELHVLYINSDFFSEIVSGELYFEKAIKEMPPYSQWPCFPLH